MGGNTVTASSAAAAMHSLTAWEDKIATKIAKMPQKTSTSPVGCKIVDRRARFISKGGTRPSNNMDTARTSAALSGLEQLTIVKGSPGSPKGRHQQRRAE